MKEFMAQVESGRITKTRMQNFLRANHNQILLSRMTEAEARASEILDRRNVITVYEVAERWAMEIDPPTRIPYTTETLERCARENDSNENWCLIYVIGLSLREQYSIRGPNIPGGRGGSFRGKPPDISDEYLKRSFQSGYYLLNIRCNFTKMGWQDQTNVIGAWGEKYKRADERMLSEAMLSRLMVKYVHFADIHPGFYHWGFGMMPECDGKRMGRVTLYQEGGNICFSSQHPDYFRSSNYGVVMLREPDF
jgi:hypothetical protein